MNEGGEPGMARINKVQREVDNVVGVMRNNIDKVLERGEKLEDIENRSGMQCFAPNFVCYIPHNMTGNGTTPQWSTLKVSVNG